MPRVFLVFVSFFHAGQRREEIADGMTESVLRHTKEVLGGAETAYEAGPDTTDEVSRGQRDKRREGQGSQ